MKTLKDFECSDNDEYSCCEDKGRSGNPHSVSTEHLRGAAREWIKELEKEEKGQWKDGSPLVAKHAKQWIKHFFNLEEKNDRL